MFAVPRDAQSSRLNRHRQPDVLALVETHVLGCFRAMQVYAKRWRTDYPRPSLFERVTVSVF